MHDKRTATLERPARQRRSWLRLASALLAAGLLSPAGAQDFERPVRVGVLTVAWGNPPHLSGIIAGLEGLGYVTNEDFVVGVRFTNGDMAALPAAAEAMVAAGVDIIVTVGPLEAQAAVGATSTHPIVFLRVGDPIGQGLVGSFAIPGGNVTGIADLSAEAAGRRLQLFAELVPGLRRVYFPYNGQNPSHIAEADEYLSAASALGIELVQLPATTMAEAESNIGALQRREGEGIIAPRDVDLNIPGFVVDTTRVKKIPSMFDLEYYTGTEVGGLASYGTNSALLGRQAARIIDEIIRGADPARIPVQTVFDLEFIVNVTVAAEIGLSVPAMVLFQADRIVR